MSFALPSSLWALPSPPNTREIKETNETKEIKQVKIKDGNMKGKIGKLKCASIRTNKGDKILIVFVVSSFTGSKSDLPFTYLAWDGERIFLECRAREKLVDFDYDLAMPYKSESEFFVISYPNLGRFLTWLDDKFMWEEEDHRIILGEFIKSKEVDLSDFFLSFGTNVITTTNAAATTTNTNATTITNTNTAATINTSTTTNTNIVKNQYQDQQS